MNLSSASRLMSTSLLAFIAVSATVQAETAQESRANLREPVLRVARATPPNPSRHPLDPALDLARTGLIALQNSIDDYTCTIVKRERIKGELGDYEYMFAKIRNRRLDNGQITVPFSVYLQFLKPAAVKGREVMYIEGQNNGKLIAKEGGTAGKYLPTVWLPPTGMLAMRGQRYPITDIGMENLVAKLIERGEREKASGNVGCQVTFHEDAKINGRTCTLLQIIYPTPDPSLEFHRAEIFIDDELQIPVRYAAYDFPATPGARPPVLEEYTYLNVKLNVGLTDRDFDHNNTAYKFH